MIRRRVIAAAVLALTVTACGDASLTHDEVAGCYVLEWTGLGGEPLSVVPDSVQLLLDPRVPWPEATHMDSLDLRQAVLFRRAVDSTLNYYDDVIWEDHWWWWHIANDSVRFGTGHDGSDWVGFHAAVHGTALTGDGIRMTDYGPDSHFNVRGQRVACPDQQKRREFIRWR